MVNIIRLTTHSLSLHNMRQGLARPFSAASPRKFTNFFRKVATFGDIFFIGAGLDETTFSYIACHFCGNSWVLLWGKEDEILCHGGRRDEQGGRLGSACPTPTPPQAWGGEPLLALHRARCFFYHPHFKISYRRALPGLREGGQKHLAKGGIFMPSGRISRHKSRC